MKDKNSLSKKYKSIDESQIIENVDGRPFPEMEEENETKNDFVEDIDVEDIDTETEIEEQTQTKKHKFSFFHKNKEEKVEENFDDVYEDDEAEKEEIEDTTENISYEEPEENFDDEILTIEENDENNSEDDLYSYDDMVDTNIDYVPVVIDEEIEKILNEVSHNDDIENDDEDILLDNLPTENIEETISYESNEQEKFTDKEDNELKEDTFNIDIKYEQMDTIDDSEIFLSDDIYIKYSIYMTEEKEEKIENTEKSSKKAKGKKEKEPMNGKDIATIIIAIIAILFAAAFSVYKFAPDKMPIVDDIDGAEESVTNKPSDKNDVANIQIARSGIAVKNLMQSDLPDVFYGFTSSGEFEFFQYKDSKIDKLANTGEVSFKIDFGNQIVPGKVKYVEQNGEKFGIGLFKADEHSDVYFYKFMLFKLTELPQEYREDGKVLLLTTTDKNSFDSNNIIWTESFVLNLNDGSVERFLSDRNRTLDSTGAGVKTFCMLTSGGYNSTTKNIPFISSREYGPDEKKYDVFVKNGNKETLLASDIYGKFVLTNGDAIIYFKKNVSGFDVIRNIENKEEIITSVVGKISEHILTGHYLLNKADGKLIDLYTGTEKVPVGYKMTADMASVSPDGKYLAVVGTIKSILDYQVHIFNLETGEFYEYKDKNPSIHFNLEFINNTQAIYIAADPSQVNEYIVIDVTKTK